MFPPSLARVLSDGGTAVETKKKKKKQEQYKNYIDIVT
jgi:hypothetical protein